jgi:maleamate amidohydrolase
VTDPLAALAEIRRTYVEAGMSARVGWGERPALVVVDMIAGFTDPACPLGSALDDEVAVAAELAHLARHHDVPVALTAVTYRPDMSDAGIWPAKIPAQVLLVEGSPWVEFDKRLPAEAGDLVVRKRHASAFLGTSLADDLRALDVDTVVVVGCTTSGCVRATVVDACGLGFRTLVVREAVGDRNRLVHEMSLFDMDSKYADVVGVDDVRAAFASRRARS